MSRSVLLAALVAVSCSKPDAPATPVPSSALADVSVASSTSASASTAPSAVASAEAPDHEECHIVGTFTGLGAADTVTTFHADATGDWEGKSVQHFAWGLQQGAAIITFESPPKGDGPFGCATGQVGRYKLTVEGCKGIKLELVEDACAARAKALGKGIGTRKKRGK